MYINSLLLVVVKMLKHRSSSFAIFLLDNNIHSCCEVTNPSLNVHGQFDCFEVFPLCVKGILKILLLMVLQSP